MLQEHVQKQDFFYTLLHLNFYNSIFPPQKKREKS